MFKTEGWGGGWREAVYWHLFPPPMCVVYRWVTWFAQISSVTPTLCPRKWTVSPARFQQTAPSPRPISGTTQHSHTHTHTSVQTQIDTQPQCHTHTCARLSAQTYTLSLTHTVVPTHPHKTLTHTGISFCIQNRTFKCSLLQLNSHSHCYYCDPTNNCLDLKINQTDNVAWMW